MIVAICTEVEWRPFLTNLGGNIRFRSLKCINPISPKANQLVHNSAWHPHKKEYA